MIDFYANPGSPPRVIRRRSRWIDPVEPAIRYWVVAEGREHVAVRILADPTHPDGRTIHLWREFGRRLRPVI